MRGVCYTGAYKNAERGTEAEEQNKDGVGLDQIAKKRKMQREESKADMKADDEDDI